MTRRLLACLAVLLVAGALALAARGSMTYYAEPTELASHPREGDVRVGGLVVEGSVERHAQGIGFLLSDGTTDIPVTYVGQPTSSFREGQGAVVEGRYDGATIVATRVLVQHSNEYRAPEDGDAP